MERRINWIDSEENKQMAKKEIRLEGINRCFGQRALWGQSYVKKWG
jgi:hypothetical protein